MTGNSNAPTIFLSKRLRLTTERLVPEIIRPRRRRALFGRHLRPSWKAFLSALLLVGAATGACGALNTTCVYDEDDLSTNKVDRVSAFAGGAGAGNESNLVPDLRTFTASLGIACAKGFGGVVDFESGSLDSAMSFTVRFHGEAKSLVIRQGTESGYVIRRYVNEVRVPISGTHALAKEQGSASFEFTFTSGHGLNPNEQVVAVGLTLLGRNNSNARSQWTGVALLQDRHGNSGAITNRVADLNTGSGRATDDAFFGFQAPPGYFIAGVQIRSDTGAFTSVDDLAFITAVVADPVVASPSPPPPPDLSQPPPQVQPGPAGDAGGFSWEWLLVGALGAVILLLLGLIMAVKLFSRNRSLLPARIPVARPADQWDSDPRSVQFPAELTEFAKQELVQSLYTQRQVLTETQRLAEQRLAELEKWLGQLQLPLQERIKAYEQRIAELERELAAKDESVRELTKATLLLVRRKLGEEKERERTYSGIS